MRRDFLRGGPAVALLLFTVACGIGTSTDDGGHSSPGSGGSGSSPYSYESLDVGGRDAIEVGHLGSPDLLAADGEHIYVKRDEGGFLVMDPETAEVLSSVDVNGELCQGLGAGTGAVWTCNGADLVKIDPVSGEVLATVPVTKTAEQGHLVVGFGRVWVLIGDGTSLLGIGTDNNTPGDPIVIPIHGSDLALSSDRIWVVSGVDNAAVEIDPNSGAVGHPVESLTGARSAIAVPGALWVGGSSASYRIDIATGAVTATVEGGVGYDGGIAADDTSVWVRRGGLTLQHLDAASGAVLEELSVEVSADPGRGGSALLAFNALWVTFYDDATLIRIPLD